MATTILSLKSSIEIALTSRIRVEALVVDSRVLDFWVLRSHRPLLLGEAAGTHGVMEQKLQEHQIHANHRATSRWMSECFRVLIESRSKLLATTRR